MILCLDLSSSPEKNFIKSTKNPIKIQLLLTYVCEYCFIPWAADMLFQNKPAGVVGPC